MTYGSEPRNLTARDVLNNPAFPSAVLRSVQDPALRGYIVGHSIPWTGIDLPMVEFLPKDPIDRAEVNLIVGDGLARMVYRAATARWYQIGAPPVVTAMPSDPVDGLTVAYNADDSAGVTWLFRYRADGDATYPWEFVGGGPLRSEVDTEQTETSNTYDNMATTGPSITLALAGSYEVMFGANMYQTTGGIGAVSFSIGATAASDTWAIFYASTTTGAYQSRTRTIPVVAGDAITMKYRTTANTLNCGARWLRITPIKVAA